MEINPSFWKGKRIFVTGGMGFIGTHLVNRLVSLETHTKLFVHNKLPVNRGLVGFTGDLCSPTAELRRFLESFKPQIIFHLAAQPIVNLAVDDHFQTLEVNIRGTYNLLSSVYHLRWLETFVHISTDKVYGNIPHISFGTIPNSTTHPYNTSKLDADLLAQMYCNTFETPVTIIRNGNVYGSGDEHWDRIVPNTMRRALSGQPPVIRGDGKALRDYIYMDDLISGYLNAAEYGTTHKKHPNIFNLGSDRPYSVIEVIDSILSIVKRIDLAPTHEPVGVGEIPNQHIVDGSAGKLIGWKPEISLEDGLSRCVQWYTDKVKGLENE